MISQNIDVAVIGGGPAGLETVRTERDGRLLPVRTGKTVHKGQLKELMQACAKLKVVPPVQIGQVIVQNILGTGADLLAARYL